MILVFRARRFFLHARQEPCPLSLEPKIDRLYQKLINYSRWYASAYVYKKLSSGTSLKSKINDNNAKLCIK